MVDSYTQVKPPATNTPIGSKPPTVDIKDPAKNKNTFPPPGHQTRIEGYEYYARLFLGDHFNAFNIRIDSEDYNRAYSKLRYVKINFAGLISKIIADMLFSEPLTIKAADGDQDFVEALWRENNMDVQCYESALGSSSLGDGVFKIRTGKRNVKDEKDTVIIEDITPRIYYPDVDGFNVRAEPETKTLAWTFEVGEATYLRKEIHTAGLIENKVYKMKGNRIEGEVSLDIIGISDLQAVIPTDIDRHLIEHVPNWKTGDRHFGLSDYYDLDAIFFAINNRMTKTDNILDKHSDPILMVPPGILDDKGKVKKQSLGVIEVGEGESGKPEYVVWDASLENAFKYVEKLVEFMYMISETSPDILGLGKGQSDSGRALKFKLMRTIAKASRKKLYYNAALKRLMYTAQLVAKQHNLEVDGLKLKGEAVVPEFEWSDGLPIDDHEKIEDEVKMVDAGLKSKKAAIMSINQVDEATAEEMLDEADEESEIEMPEMAVVPNIDNKVDNKVDNKFNKGKVGKNATTPKPGNI